MIDLATTALVASIRSRTRDLGRWVVVSSLSGDDPAPKPKRLAVCLLSVEVRDEPARSPVPVRGGGPGPAPLRLEYLLTYFGGHLEAQQRLARVLEALRERPVLGPADLPAAAAARIARLTVTVRTPSAEERSRTWTSLGRPGRLALFCTVDLVPQSV